MPLPNGCASPSTALVVAGDCRLAGSFKEHIVCIIIVFTDSTSWVPRRLSHMSFAVVFRQM